MKLRVAGFLDNSLVNGPGLRSVVFVSGCSHNCKNCHNRTMQDYNYGEVVTIDKIINRIKENKPLIRGVTFSGGEPFESAKQLSELSKKVKEENLNIWCYTGYTFEQIINSNDEEKIKLLQNIDVLIDGKFNETLKQGANKYTGSRNQRIIDVKNSLRNNSVVSL